MVAAVAQTNSFTKVRAVASNVGRFMTDGQDKLAKTAGILPLVAALLAMASTVMSDKALDPKKQASMNGIEKFLANNFGLFTDATFAGQAGQALIAASPAKVLAYVPLIFLNHLFNVGARKEAKAIVQQIIERINYLHSQGLSEEGDQEFQRLTQQLEQQKATLGFWMQLMIGIIGFTFSHNLALTPLRKDAIKRTTDISKTWPLKKAEIEKMENRQATFKDWLSLMKENAGREFRRTTEFYGMFNPKNIRGTFLGKNEVVEEALAKGEYRRAPNNSLSTKDLVIPLPKDKPLRRAWFKFSASAAPTAFTGININARLGSLALLVGSVALGGWSAIQHYFAGKYSDPNQNSLAKGMVELSSAASKVGVAASTISNISMLGPIGLVTAGVGPCLGWATGGTLYGLSLLTNMLPGDDSKAKQSIAQSAQWFGTLALFGANGLLVLQQPIRNFMARNNIVSFTKKPALERRGLTKVAV